jgi:hypothetical protein
VVPFLIDRRDLAEVRLFEIRQDSTARVCQSITATK